MCARHNHSRCSSTGDGAAAAGVAERKRQGRWNMRQSRSCTKAALKRPLAGCCGRACPPPVRYHKHSWDKCRPQREGVFFTNRRPTSHSEASADLDVRAPESWRWAKISAGQPAWGGAAGSRRDERQHGGPPQAGTKGYNVVGAPRPPPPPHWPHQKDVGESSEKFSFLHHYRPRTPRDHSQPEAISLHSECPKNFSLQSPLFAVPSSLFAPYLRRALSS